MAKNLEKEKAIFLRKKGVSIKSIAKELKVSSSTASFWCRDIVLSKEQVLKLQKKQKKAGLKSILSIVEKRKEDRIEAVRLFTEEGRKDVGELNTRDLFMVGLSLYWGEGYKKGNDELGFTNSDPKIIKVIVKWFKDIYFVRDEDFILRVSINNEHEFRENKVIDFWSNLLGIPKNQFTKTSFIKTKLNKIYLNKENHFGTLRVKVRRGTNLRRRILGSISSLDMF